MGHPKHHLLFLFGLILLSQNCQSWGWAWPFSSQEDPSGQSTPEHAMISKGTDAEFTMEAPTSPRGKELVEKAQRMLAGPNSCWRSAYQNLYASCSEVLAVDERRSRLAWHLSDCFQKDSGRPPFPYCDPKSSMLNCLKNLNGDAHKIYLEFYLETNSICHQLQTDAFKRQTERLVNELKRSAKFAEDKLESIEEKAEDLLQSSSQIHDSLDSIYLRTQQVAEASRDAENNVNILLKNTEAIYNQSEGIAASQSLLTEEQAKMKENLYEGMAMLHESYDNLVGEIDDLRKEAAEIEKEISRIGNAMSLKMKTLQIKADEIGIMSGSSLEKQRQLLDGQSAALEGLDSLTKFQSQALEESRVILQRLAEFGHRQHEELLQKQERIQQAHDHLVENSKSILAAQEAFESRQASMFIAIDKLFALHNAILVESRLLKALIVYSVIIFVLYMFTSTKQTYPVRPRLYIGVCATVLIECVILRYATNGIEHQTLMINLIRSLFVLLASIQLLYAICTYRDYELLNHQILLTLIEKVNGMQRDKELSWEADSDVSWSSWIHTELPDDIDNVEDPDYLLPEEVGENSVATTSITRKYELRSRCHH